MFKSESKVVCIKNCRDYFIKNKTYTITEEGDENYTIDELYAFSIISEDFHWNFDEYFIFLTMYRKQKLEKIENTKKYVK